MSEAGRRRLEETLGLARGKWNEKLAAGKASDDFVAAERKLGTPEEQWPGDFGGEILDQSAITAEVTGGTISTDGPDQLHTFSGNGTLTITGAAVTVDYLLVGGGGSGGAGSSTVYGGGGGAGRVLSGSVELEPGSYPVVIGAGGAAIPGVDGNAAGNTGSQSTFNGLTAGGGGGGARPDGDGLAGASGGGGGGSATAQVGGAGTGAGFDGGDGFAAGDGTRASGGGGGAGAVGGNASANTAGVGGAGVANSITGSSVNYGVGGRGCGVDIGDVVGTDGVNAGDGGGGSKRFASGAGANGVLIIRWTPAA